MKNTFTKLLLTIAAIIALGGCAAKAPSGSTGTTAYSGPELDNLTSNPNRLAVIETKLGTIKIQFFDKIAPKHVEHFIKLAKEGFYNGTTFHRVIPGFMIQGGDPNSKDDDLSNDGYGQPGLETVPAEFSTFHHKRGIISAARTNDPNSASSQFFLMVDENSSLNNKYSIYGQVVEGMDVADKIVSLPRNDKDNPGKAAEIISVKIVD
jgi:peptidyl-prolyl cis-trans isomerase B (cyclophilin B)